MIVCGTIDRTGIFPPPPAACLNLQMDAIVFGNAHNFVADTQGRQRPVSTASSLVSPLFLCNERRNVESNDRYRFMHLQYLAIASARGHKMKNSGRGTCGREILV